MSYPVCICVLTIPDTTKSGLKTVHLLVTLQLFSSVAGKAAQLFTSVLFNNYAPPPGFCFDVLCDDEPIIDDKHSPDYNVDKMVCLSLVI